MNILKLPYHNEICVMGWLVESCYNLRKKGFEFDPLMHKKNQGVKKKSFIKVLLLSYVFFKTFRYLIYIYSNKNTINILKFYFSYTPLDLMAMPMRRPYVWKS